MHVGKIYVENNIVYHKEVVTYYFNIKPINSLFASDTQVSTLLENMKDKILGINMPGEIIIRPVAINGAKIVNAYKHHFKRYGVKSFSGIAKDYIEDIKKINCGKLKYNYEIYIAFTDGRDELKRKHSFKITGVNNDEPTKEMYDIFRVCEEQMYKKLCNGLFVTRLQQEQVVALHNYLACPIEQKVSQYYVEPSATHLKYQYKLTGLSQYKTMCSKTLIASRFETHSIHSQANTVLNKFQLAAFPIDTIIKFDLEHTKEFVRDMSAKREKIWKANRRHWKATERQDKEAIKAEKIAIAGESVDESLEKSKVRWQMLLRVRAVNEDMLEKRTTIIRETLRGGKSRIGLSEEVGEQILLADHLFPYRSEFKRYLQLSDVGYFVHYNYLGGLFIGDEEEGLIATYTQPGKKPIFHDSSKPLMGKTKSTGSTIIIAGESGSGKTQLADSLVFSDMLFKGMRVLTIDPKGDREKKIELLKENASHLKIGSKECVDGMFDPYLMNADNQAEALSQAKKDITSFARALNERTQINFMQINRAHEDMLAAKKEGEIKQCTLPLLLHYLHSYDSLLSDQVMSLAIDPIARLFFASQKTRIDQSFNLNKMYNLITFERMPLYDAKEDRVVDFNPNQLEHAIFAVVFSRVMAIVNGFMKRFGAEENQLVLDEFRIFKSVPGGEEVAKHCNRQCRSWQTHLYIITQLLSDISTDILENTAEKYIGSMKSKAAVEYVLDELGLEEHETVRATLRDKTKSEGVKEEDQYNFLYEDYNNRKCITKLIIPPSFMKYFDTQKQEDKNVPVTGTSFEESYYEEAV